MKRLAIALALLASPALAQQQPLDAPTLQRLIPKLVQQRDEEMLRAAQAEVRAAQLAEENQKLKAELASKEPKQSPP